MKRLKTSFSFGELTVIVQTVFTAAASSAHGTSADATTAHIVRAAQLRRGDFDKAGRLRESDEVCHAGERSRDARGESRSAARCHSSVRGRERLLLQPANQRFDDIVAMRGLAAAMLAQRL